MPKAGARRARQCAGSSASGSTALPGTIPNQLSGGMQQRVGLARALTNDAPILLMDEAYSALDPLIRVDMQTVLLDLQKELKKTIVFITHDLDEALRLGDKIAILRDGEVIQQGSAADIVLNPANDYIEAFVKEVNRSRVIRIEALMEPLSNPASETVIRIPGQFDRGGRHADDDGKQREPRDRHQRRWPPHRPGFAGRSRALSRRGGTLGSGFRTGRPRAPATPLWNPHDRDRTPCGP